MVTFLSVSFVMLTTVGIMVSSGTFFPYILEEFQESRASTAAIQSIFYGVGMGTGKRFCYYFEPVCHTDSTASKVINISLGYILLQSNLDYSKCKGPQESFRIIGNSIAYRWQAVGGPTLCAFWAGNFSFISAKTYDLGVKRNRLDESVVFSIRT